METDEAVAGLDEAKLASIVQCDGSGKQAKDSAAAASGGETVATDDNDGYDPRVIIVRAVHKDAPQQVCDFLKESFPGTRLRIFCKRYILYLRIIPSAWDALWHACTQFMPLLRITDVAFVTTHRVRIGWHDWNDDGSPKDTVVDPWAGVQPVLDDLCQSQGGSLDGVCLRISIMPRRMLTPFGDWLLKVKGIQLSPTQYTHVINLCIDPKTHMFCCGWQKREDSSLAVIPSDRVHDGLASSAYYKMTESIHRWKIPVETWSKALDIGASPGGWTQALLRRGVPTVVCVDPGAPYPALATDERVTWHRCVVQKAPLGDDVFDGIVWDANICSFGDCFAILGPLTEKHLCVGGYVVYTLKLFRSATGARNERKRREYVTKAVKVAAVRMPHLECIGVKHLMVNKNERTMVFRRLSHTLKE